MEVLPNIDIVRFFHRGESRIGLKFNYDDKLIKIVRTLPKARWSSTKKLWYIEDSKANLKQIETCFKNFAKLDFTSYNNTSKKHNSTKSRNLNQNQKDSLNGFYKYLKGKRYSQSTINTYTHFIADFIEFHGKKLLSDLTNRDIELFIETVFIKQKYSISTQRQFISAVKLFIVFEPTTQINNLQLTRPKKDKILPKVLSQNEVISLLQHTENLKHRAITALLYSCGLRVSELINLKLKNININRKQILVSQSKGRRDRYVNLAESFIPLLLNYLNTYKPVNYFAEGKNNMKYSAESIRNFLRRNSLKAQTSIKVTPHILRHSYATHMLENGVDIRYIQVLLGHSRPETTMIYTHVTKKDLMQITNPLDIAVKKLTDKTNNNVGLSRKINR